MLKKQTLVTVVGCLLALLLAPVIALGATPQSSSPNYQVNEVFFGSGGELNACSTTYCSKQSIGETVVGNTKGSSYQAQGGFNTDRIPYIQATVNNPATDLGTLSPTSTKTATATFTVEAYLSHGYTVINASGPPTNGGYTMAAMATPGSSSAGTEQFGINLVANTSPTTFGANPVQIPNNTFAFGQVSAAYNTSNQYKYSQGETIAFSTSSTSETTYTISYIFNVSNVTPGGTFTLNHVLVITGTY